MNDIKLYLDMDGVLADFDSEFEKIRRELGVSNTIVFNKPSSLLTGEEAALKDMCWNEIISVSGFWEKMRKMPDADQCLRYCQKNFKNVFILTTIPKPYRENEKWVKEVEKAKKEWLKRHFDIQETNILIDKIGSKEKMILLNPDKRKILVDDRIENIEKWEKKGGTGFVYSSLKEFKRKMDVFLKIR